MEQDKNTPQIIAHMVESYSGPIPHPEIVEKYERMTPGAADRILSMAEEAQKHKHAMDKAYYDMMKRSLNFSLISIALLAIVIIVALILDRPIAAIATAIAAVASVAGIFIYSKSTANKK